MLESFVHHYSLALNLLEVECHRCVSSFSDIAPVTMTRESHLQVVSEFMSGYLRRIVEPRVVVFNVSLYRRLEHLSTWVCSG